MGGIIFIMGKIAYHLKGADVVSIAFNAENLKGDELNGKIAIRILESLKAQNALDMVVFTDENNETINLI